MAGGITFWIVRAVAFIALIAGRLPEWLDTGAPAGAIGLSIRRSAAMPGSRQPPPASPPPQAG